tara:strand:+ start:20548 stop:21009 length:462 start_codon:yes stop_codon:yes gene_type:complete
MSLEGLKNNWYLSAFGLFLLFANSHAQDLGNKVHQQDKVLDEKMELQHNFFDAKRFRTDLKFNSNKRILFTTLENIMPFDQKYKGTEMSLEYVIRDRLHTAIFLNQKKNYLKSMDGSEFRLSQNLSAVELTQEVVLLIGAMYYGADEVKALVQ